jgi:hypothetical protein
MLTDDMQLIALKNALAGEPLGHNPDHFSGDAGKVARVVGWAQQTGKDVGDALEALLMVDAGVAALIAAIPLPVKLLPTRKPVLLTDVNFPPVKWLYHGYFVRGHANTVVADAGTGKNWFALDLAMKVSNGLPWPNQDGATCEAGNVGWIDGENFGDGNKERIKQWLNAGLYRESRIYSFPQTSKMYLGDKATQDAIVRWIDSFKPSLIIADSWDTLMEENTFKGDVQGALDFIDQVASTYNLCWLNLSHPHKRKFAKPTDALTPDEAAGSRLFKGKHRIMYAMYFAQTGSPWRNTDPRIVSMIKCNFKWPHHNKFTLDMQPLHPDGLMMNYLPYADLIDQVEVKEGAHDAEILEAIDTLENPTSAEVAKYLGVNAGQVSRWVKNLEASGRIFRAEGRNNPWRVL